MAICAIRVVGAAPAADTPVPVESQFGWISVSAPVDVQIYEHQRLVGRRLKIVRGHELSSVFFQRVKSGMGVGKVKFSAWHQHGCNDFRPFLHIRQPANRSPSREDKIERARRQIRGLVYSPLDEIRVQAGLMRQAPCDVERGAGKIQSGSNRAAPYQA